ncbi:MAG: ribose-phosphate pyrophosphokinase [Elusimicrobiota bacterium]|nr:ribose-phosphate pyrophosphokinase [Endomicrobiia bacterium]MDW8165914.1 ribose-phosphate pyrophosphokinase [Elusimicrobiota bacterium]
MNTLRVFSGNANKELYKEIVDNLGIPEGKIYVGRFADGEVEVKIEENIRGKDCFVVQPTCPPVNENLMELLVIIDALKRASAARITAVIPYFGYARQDRKAEPRVPITSKLVANLIVAAGTNRVLTIDLHAGQIQGFFDIPVDHLYATPVFLDYLNNHPDFKNRDNVVVVSPDAGGVERARAFAKRLNSSLAIVDKRRPSPNQAEVLNIIGDVKNKIAIVFDDIIDTGGTMIKVVERLKKEGAEKVYAVCTHAVLSMGAEKKIENSFVEKLLVTNTIPLGSKKNEKIEVLSVGKLLAEAIRRIHLNTSVSELFV